MTYYDPADTMRQTALKSLSAETVSEIQIIKEYGQAFYTRLNLLPQSADMTLAKRKVEEAVMWAVKAVTA